MRGGVAVIVVALATLGAMLAIVSYAFDAVGLAGVLGLLLVAVIVVWTTTQPRPEPLWVLYGASMVLLPLSQARIQIGALLVPPPAFVAALAMGVIAIHALQARRPPIVYSRAYVWLALVLLGFVISLPTARLVEFDLLQLAKWTFHAILVMLVGSMTVPQWRLLMAQSLALSTGGLAAYGLATYISGNRYDVNFYEGIGTRGASAMHLAIVLPLIVGLIGMRGGGVLRRGVLIAAATVAVLALAFTYARAGWVALLMALLVMTLAGRQGVAVVGLLVVSLGLVLWAPEPVQTRFESIFMLGGYGEHSSVTNARRIELMREALALIAERPIVGVGLGNYTTAIPWYLYSETPYGAVPHNAYLLVWAEGGLLAFLGLVGLLGTTGARLLRVLRITTAPSDRARLIGLLGSWVAIVTFMLFADDINHLLVWTMLGLGISTSRARLGQPTAVEGREEDHGEPTRIVPSCLRAG